MALTKSHKTAQPPAYKQLSPEQENAIDLLILGKPDREVAEAVGITRETIWRWRHEHPVFLAELNRRRQALWAEAHERLRALVGKAVDAIEQAIGYGDVKAAIELLKAGKVYGEVGAPQGLTDPEAILQARAQTQAWHELGYKSPLQVALRRLDGGYHDRPKARAEELLTELREPFCDALHGLGTNTTQEA